MTKPRRVLLLIAVGTVIGRDTPLPLSYRVPPDTRSVSVLAKPKSARPTLDTPTDDPWIQAPRTVPPGVRVAAEPVVRGRFRSVQVNVDGSEANIPGDAANEPSLAIDPNDPDRIVIGWRQFDSVESSFRQAGYAYSHDGGETWTFPGSLTPGVFGSDPVLDVDSSGTFYYISINFDETRLFRSFDGGVTWTEPLSICSGLCDKPWMVVDRTGGPGDGHVYWMYTDSPVFIRFREDLSIMDHALPIGGRWTTLSVAPNGILYGPFFRSEDARDGAISPPTVRWGEEWLLGRRVLAGWQLPNPGGLLGQRWVAADHQSGPCRGRVYVVASVVPLIGGEPGGDLDVYFARSGDGGFTWARPQRINDDLEDNGAAQWFGTLSVAPNGRIDVIWNDTRNSDTVTVSELFYAWSYDGGVTWYGNEPASHPFDSTVGWPRQNKIGDYYDMVSDNEAANLAYAATFNGEQDVFFLRLSPDCDGNGIGDAQDIAAGNETDCSGNGIPDACERDCNGNGRPDDCDIVDGVSGDGNANGIPDECEPDRDGDLIPDYADDDIDGDGVPNMEDLCVVVPIGLPADDNGALPFDANLDCAIDLWDFEEWWPCLSSGGPAIQPGTCFTAVDTDADGDADLADLADLQRFFGIGQNGG